MELIHRIEKISIALRDRPPEGDVAAIDGVAARVSLPLERPLHREPERIEIADGVPEIGNEDLDASVLYTLSVVDRDELARRIRLALQDQPVVTLQDLCVRWPLEDGLAEVLAYLELATGKFGALIDETKVQILRWFLEDADGDPVRREATVPHVVFSR